MSVQRNWVTTKIAQLRSEVQNSYFSGLPTNKPVDEKKTVQGSVERGMGCWILLYVAPLFTPLLFAICVLPLLTVPLKQYV